MTRTLRQREHRIKHLLAYHPGLWPPDTRQIIPGTLVTAAGMPGARDPTNIEYEALMPGLITHPVMRTRVAHNTVPVLLVIGRTLLAGTAGIAARLAATLREHKRAAALLAHHPQGLRHSERLRQELFHLGFLGEGRWSRNDFSIFQR